MPWPWASWTKALNSSLVPKCGIDHQVVRAVVLVVRLGLEDGVEVDGGHARGRPGSPSSWRTPSMSPP